MHESDDMVTREDYVGTLTVNLMALRRHDFTFYLCLAGEWLDMFDTASIEDIVQLERRVITALERCEHGLEHDRMSAPMVAPISLLQETHVCFREVDWLIGSIRDRVDRMRALSDSEIAYILARLDVFEEEFHRQSDYLRPKEERYA